MTVVRLFKNGFSVKGHCTVDASDEAGRLVCAAVSSAVYMAVNTITDVVGDNADFTEKDGRMDVFLPSASKETGLVLKGLSLHLQQLSEQYPDCIKVNSEV